MDRLLGLKKVPQNENDIKLFLSETIDSKPMKVLSVSINKKQTHPPPPFITSTLQIEAQKRGISAKQVMSLAQKLYESGLITYMRTDSMHVSLSACEEMKQYILKTYSPSYLTPRTYEQKKTKKKTQTSEITNVKTADAHECIRIIDSNALDILSIKSADSFTAAHQKLYELIWKRSLASQMSPEQYNESIIEIEQLSSKTS